MTKQIMALFVVLGIVASALADDFDFPRAEFEKYHKQITGKDPPAGLVEFAVDPKVSASGNDAYTIVSTQKGAKITGSRRRCCTSS